MKVKICGITTPEDLRNVDGAGADFAGFVFYAKSPRFVSEAQMRELSRVPVRLKKVGIFVRTAPAVIARMVELGGLDVVQLYGCAFRRAGVEVWQAVPGRHPKQVIVLDTAPGKGNVGDWQQAARLARTRRLVLSGGLTPENVEAAIRAVKPWCVDVSSGTESTFGHKDMEKVTAFIRKAKQ